LLALLSQSREQYYPYDSTGVNTVSSNYIRVLRIYRVDRSGWPLSLRLLLAEFKPRLEKIVQDVSIVTDVAHVADMIDKGPDAEQIVIDPADLKPTKMKGIGNISTEVQWRDVLPDPDNTGDAGPEEGEGLLPESLEDQQAGRGLKRGDTPEASKTQSGSLQIKELLDRWEDPIDDSDKVRYTQEKLYRSR
jgi:hypothetical protein